MDEGIKVLSWDSGVAAEGRHVHINQADAQLIGQLQVQAIAEMIGYEGEIAILSAGATMTNQNTWIEYMKQELEDPKYDKMELVTIVYGDDLREKSYNEAMGPVSYTHLDVYKRQGFHHGSDFRCNGRIV